MLPRSRVVKNLSIIHDANHVLTLTILGVALAAAPYRSRAYRCLHNAISHLKEELPYYPQTLSPENATNRKLHQRQLTKATGQA